MAEVKKPPNIETLSLEFLDFAAVRRYNAPLYRFPALSLPGSSQ
jgi:hypothetical protein